MNESVIRILLVEDNEEDFIIIREWLSNADDGAFCLERADDLAGGLAELRKGKTDVVLLDMSLPDCEGLETLLRVRAQVTDVPIIMLTGLADEDLAIEAIHRGAQDYLVKGQVDVDGLRRAMRYAMERHRAECTLRRYRDHLETLVHARTTELRKSNHELDLQIQERRQAEEDKAALYEQLLNARKLEALGRIAEGVAHEFNNSLMMITGYGELLRDRLPENDPLQEDLLRIIEAGQRATSLTQKLLAFGRKQVLTLGLLSLNDLLTGGAEAVRPFVAEDITMTTVASSEPLFVEVDRVQIEQVLINLASNAGDAMPDGGELILRAETVILDRTPDGSTDKDTRFARLCVEDTGPGIDHGTVKKIYEPFFSTKKDGRPGLGLSVVHGIMGMHGGWVDVVSGDGGGSVFHLYLPAVPADKEPGDTAVESDAAPPRGDGGLIMIVEDEPDIRVFLKRVLCKNGYEVLLAGSIAEALAEFRKKGDRCGLLFSDVVLPDGNALQLIDELRSDCPGLKVLLSSGHADQKSQRGRIIDRGLPFLEKPYTVGQLLTMVSGVLHSK